MEELCQVVAKGRPFTTEHAKIIMDFQYGNYEYGSRFSLVLIVRICALLEMPSEVCKNHIKQYVRTAPHPNQLWPKAYNSLLLRLYQNASFEQFQVVINDIYISGHTVEVFKPPKPILYAFTNYSAPEINPGFDLYLSSLARAVSNIIKIDPLVYLLSQDSSYAVLALRHYIYHLLAKTPQTGSVFRDSKNMERFISHSLAFDSIVKNVYDVINESGLTITENVPPEHVNIQIALGRLFELQAV